MRGVVRRERERRGGARCAILFLGLRGIPFVILSSCKSCAAFRVGSAVLANVAVIGTSLLHDLSLPRLTVHNRLPSTITLPHCVPPLFYKFVSSPHFLAAYWMIFRFLVYRPQLHYRLLSGMLVAAGVCSMHYTGMYSAIYRYTPGVRTHPVQGVL